MVTNQISLFLNARCYIKRLHSVDIGIKKSVLQAVKSRLNSNIYIHLELSRYYPTLPCEYNIVQIPYYLKVNSPEFTTL